MHVLAKFKVDLFLLNTAHDDYDKLDSDTSRKFTYATYTQENNYPNDFLEENTVIAFGLEFAVLPRKG